MSSKARDVAAPRLGAPSAQQEMLADLAELMLNITREINFHTWADHALIHLTATEITALRYIERHPGSTSKEVASGVGLQRSNFSVALRTLKDKGLVTVTSDSSDGRCLRLSPTDAAAENLAHHRARWAKLLAPALRSPLKAHECLEVLAMIDEALSVTRHQPS